MKTIELVKINCCQARVADYEEVFQHRIDPHNYTEMVAGDEVLMLSRETYEVENTPIHCIVEHGVEHYIAVTHKVWEFLYLIENPVTAKTQQREIARLKEQVSDWRVRYGTRSFTLDALSRKMKHASFWQRLKWLFTGVKL